MSNVIPVKFSHPPTEKLVEQIVLLDDLGDSELVRLMVELMDEVKRRAPELRGHSQKDYQGRLWAMTAIMRSVQYKINAINAVVGKGMVQ